MTENMAKWPSGQRKTEKSGHRLAAENTQFPRRWYGGMISANLEVIWEMSVYTKRQMVFLCRVATNVAEKWSVGVSPMGNQAKT